MVDRSFRHSMQRTWSRFTLSRLILIIMVIGVFFGAFRRLLLVATEGSSNIFLAFYPVLWLVGLERLLPAPVKGDGWPIAWGLIAVPIGVVVHLAIIALIVRVILILWRLTADRKHAATRHGEWARTKTQVKTARRGQFSETE